MAGEAEVNEALAAGAKFKPAIRTAYYDQDKDELTLEIRWGKLTIPRSDLLTFKDIEPEQMAEIYASHTGLHIDDIDFDVNSAGLLREVFRVLGASLTPSF
jgi:hypothetical protein